MRICSIALLMLICIQCVKPRTAIWSRTLSPDSKLEAVVAWVEDTAGATGGSGTTKVFVVSRSAQVDPTGPGVAELYTDADKSDIHTVWLSANVLRIETLNYHILQAQHAVTVDSSEVQIQLTSKDAENRK